MRKIVGTQRYMAPELLHGSTEISVENFKTIDVYAMGLVSSFFSNQAISIL